MNRTCIEAEDQAQNETSGHALWPPLRLIIGSKVDSFPNSEQSQENLDHVSFKHFASHSCFIMYFVIKRRRLHVRCLICSPRAFREVRKFRCMWFDSRSQDHYFNVVK
jgi:hypothetical protein